MHKETRKIIKAGNTSLAVTLPKSWIRYFKLKSGDKVELVSDSFIVIKPLVKGGKFEWNQEL